jgi:hypothetical protein
VITLCEPLTQRERKNRGMREKGVRFYPFGIFFFLSPFLYQSVRLRRQKGRVTGNSVCISDCLSLFYGEDRKMTGRAIEGKDKTKGDFPQISWTIETSSRKTANIVRLSTECTRTFKLTYFC